MYNLLYNKFWAGGWFPKLRNKKSHQKIQQIWLPLKNYNCYVNSTKQLRAAGKRASHETLEGLIF